MRIIAGAFRGMRLEALGKGDARGHLRPTPDRVREAVFNVLGAKLDWQGLVVLDLFAGTGALGLEALSRGAAFVTFVENGRVGQRLIAANIARLGCAAQTRVLGLDATRLPVPAAVRADLVFLDPPYGKGLGAAALSRTAQGGWLAEEALVAWEEAAPQDPPPGFALLQHRSYGSTHLTLLHRVPD